MTEVQRYEVVGKKPGFEIRQYAPHLLVTKSMSGSLSAAGSNAFRYLAGYIGGENADRQQIAMTAPVLQHKQPSGYEVAFVMPDHMEDAPAPLREGMEVKKVDGVLMAAKRFSGLATDELFERKGRYSWRSCELPATNQLVRSAMPAITAPGHLHRFVATRCWWR